MPGWGYALARGQSWPPRRRPKEGEKGRDAARRCQVALFVRGSCCRIIHPHSRTHISPVAHDSSTRSVDKMYAHACSGCGTGVSFILALLTGFSLLDALSHVAA
jgi:hypothetical protein